MIKKFLIGMTLTLGLFGCGSKPVDQYVGTGPVQLYIKNESAWPNEKVIAMLPGLNGQLQGEFKQNWVIDARISFEDPPNASYRTVILLDNFSRFPQAWHKSLGFHTTGTLAYVDIEECKVDDVVSLVTSHEILEMLVNPNVAPNGYEICDPIHREVYAYRNNGVMVSDFAYPAFYNPGAPAPYDHTGNLVKPLTPAPGSVLFATLQSMLKLSAWHREVIVQKDF